MTLATYADLTATIARTLRRTDLAADIPTWITLTEAQINRRLRVRRMIGQATAVISNEYAALPLRFAGVATFDLSSGDTLAGLDAEVLSERALRFPSASMPRYYAVVGDTFRFWPAPDATYTAELTYYVRVPPLTATNPTNWLLTDHPDVYLYGALLQSAPFLKADDRMQVWSSLFLAALEDIKANDSEDLHSGRQAALRVDSFLTRRGWSDGFVPIRSVTPPVIDPPVITPDPVPDVVYGNADFSNAANSGLLAAIAF